LRPAARAARLEWIYSTPGRTGKVAP
jgi:hypothetical protein